MAEVILAAIMMFLFKECSRNQMNEDREEEIFGYNYKKLFGLKLPHMDTVSNVMKKLELSHLESIRRLVIKEFYKLRSNYH